ncbi:Isochorismatase-like protein [Pyronema domesticum]|uniref:nicotinamidase n=1 Tax=Pyronema omphalodes (strain CBS 100304) TaxID=1076935 RepID=U4LC72_PYROM|nr:Isochorismatase-like protein [Pyronema domesticum]CCX07917.1 Similar to Pyrazinamidase/nicotinamidase; acc. no. P21369 [Pyronema omphalodes CBS 100304]
MPRPDPFVPALLVVDLQEDFCPGGSLAVPRGRETIPPINTLLSLPFALRLATQDWHPSTHISFASNHPSDPAPFISSTIITHPEAPELSYTSTLWPVHCVQNTPGAELLPELKKEQLHAVIKKGIDERVEMYSAFVDPFKWIHPEGKAVHESGMEERLREKGVTDVFVVGLAMDYCVKETALDAMRLGFRVWVVREGTKAVGGEQGERETEEELGKQGVQVVGIEGEEVGWVSMGRGGMRLGLKEL